MVIDSLHIKKKDITIKVDVLIFTIENKTLKVLLLKRDHDPFKDCWAFPGGSIDITEDLENAAFRVLEEKTGVRDVYLEQLYSFGNVSRDPRGRVITITYFALIPAERYVNNGSEHEHAEWIHVYDNLPDLAFDHDDILEYALEQLKYRIKYTFVGFQLLPPKFTMTEIQDVYESILNEKLDRRNFRKKLLSLNIIKPLEETKMEGPHRPARLYMFLGDEAHNPV